MADDPDVGIRLLGGFEVTVAGSVVPAGAWRLRKAKNLVKIVALADAHRMHREALVEILWADRDAASSSNNLHQTLYAARRALSAASPTLLCLRDDVVLLSAGAMPRLDTDDFDLACSRALRSQNPDDYRTAADLYRGDLLPEDRFEPWAEGPREALREKHLGLLIRFADLLSARDEHTQVVDVVSRVLAADPVHEGACRLLMAALSASGRRYEALAAFDRLREVLDKEYRAQPEPATRQLYRSLLTAGDPPARPIPVPQQAGPPAVVLPPGPPAMVLPAGPPGPPAEVRAPRPPDLAHRLRLDQTSFVGRRREISEVTSAMGRTRLLTLTGPGGSGKTRLAYQVALGLADGFPDGVHVAELASLSRPELVPQTVASALDLALPDTGPPEVALAGQLVERGLLLVLDNCEHLLDACSRVVAELLRSCPGVVVLATSREPLRVGGERTWRTPSLALPNLSPLPSLEQLAELESVQLFVERAQAAAPFSLDVLTAPAVAEICVRLDGMPLAVELAAARTSALAPAQIAARLGDALHVLDRGSRAAVTRQQTLQATLSWSHDLLTDDERVVFRRLAVFAGGMTVEAAEHVCAGGGLDVVDLLCRLVDKSLVQVEQGSGTARYRLLETIRQFADQRLREAGEKPAAVRAHREFYVGFAGEHDPERAVGVVNDTPQALEAEHDNFRAALSSGLAEDPGLALRLAVSLWRFWLACGHFCEGSRWLEAALAAAPERTGLRAQGLLAAAAMEVRRGDPTARQDELGVEAVAIVRELGDDRALARTLQVAGLLAWVVDEDWPHAENLVEESLALATSAGDRALVAGATHMLGMIALLRGAGPQGEALLVAAVDLLSGLPADLAPFFPVVTPGFCWEPGGEGQRPRMPFSETLLLFRRVGPQQAAAYALSNLSYALRLRGDVPGARTLLERSVQAFERRGDLHGTALALCSLANVHRIAGRLPEAAALLERSLALRRDLGDRRAVGMTLINQGLVAAAAGQLGQADRLLREALLLFEEMQDGPGRWGALLDLGLVLLDAGEHDRARRVLQEWQELPLVSWSFRCRAWNLLVLADLERGAGDGPAARRCEDEAAARFRALDDVPGLAHLAGRPKPRLSVR